MATATKTIKQVPIPQPVVLKDVPFYTLELTEAEAQTIRDVFALVSGSPEVSRRKHVQAISEALYLSGIKYRGAIDMRGSCAFLDGGI